MEGQLGASERQNVTLAVIGMTRLTTECCC